MSLTTSDPQEIHPREDEFFKVALGIVKSAGQVGSQLFLRGFSEYTFKSALALFFKVFITNTNKNRRFKKVI